MQTQPMLQKMAEILCPAYWSGTSSSGNQGSAWTRQPTASCPELSAILTHFSKEAGLARVRLVARIKASRRGAPLWPSVVRVKACTSYLDPYITQVHADEPSLKAWPMCVTMTTAARPAHAQRTWSVRRGAE